MSYTQFPAAASGKVGQPYSLLITGSQNWTCPTGVTQVKATIISGGGSSGYGPGGYLSTTVPVVPGTTYPIVVGSTNGDTSAFTLKATRSGSANPDTGTAGDTSLPGNVPLSATNNYPSTTNGYSNVSWRSATYFKNIYYMFNQGGSAWAIHTSSDGITWNNNAVTGGSGFGGIASNATHVAYLSTNDKTVRWSSDGLAFNSVQWADASGITYLGYINNLWIVGGYNKIWWSNDVTLPQASWSTASVTINDYVFSVSYGNGLWAVCKQYAGSSNVVGQKATSLSGTWSSIDVGGPYMWGQSMVFNGGRFLLVNGPQPGYQGRCWSSTDLVNWSMNYFSSETGATGGSEIFTSPNGNGILICGYWNQNMYYWDGSTSAPINVGLRANTVALPYGNANGRTYTFQSGTSNTGTYFQMCAGNPKITGYNYTPITNAGIGGPVQQAKNSSNSVTYWTPGPGINGWGCGEAGGGYGSSGKPGAVLLEWSA